MVLAGATVVCTDADGVERPALVTAVWREPSAADDPRPAVNLVVVCRDPARVDPYGRQTERRTAVPHQSRSWARAGCWRGCDEERTPATAVLVA